VYADYLDEHGRPEMAKTIRDLAARGSVTVQLREAWKTIADAFGTAGRTVVDVFGAVGAEMLRFVEAVNAAAGQSPAPE
jgi:hypothetical protein